MLAAHVWSRARYEQQEITNMVFDDSIFLTVIIIRKWRACSINRYPGQVGGRIIWSVDAG